MALSMSDEELRKRIKGGTPVQILAELNGVSPQTIYNWMKKNEVTREKPQEEKPVELAPEVEAVLDVMKEQFSAVKDQIDQMELRIEPLKVQLRIWSELIKEVEDGKFT